MYLTQVSTGWQRGFPWRVMGHKLSAWCVIGHKLAAWGVIGHSSVFLAGWYVIFYVHNAWRVNFLIDFRDWGISFETRSTWIKNRYSRHIFFSTQKGPWKQFIRAEFFKGRYIAMLTYLLELHSHDAWWLIQFSTWCVMAQKQSDERDAW